MPIEEFIEIYRENIENLMGYNGLGFSCDQEEIEDFLMNNEEMSRLMEKEGVEI